ncbi:hypothetical protein GTO27_13395, partial [Candidatus Bathyarchaeota archaeon]|nr:hypothetical protein [Candidatus Bathyarchaeota archaeon]
MNCAKCNESIENSWQIRIPEHGVIGVCLKCHEEFAAINALSNAILNRVLRDWFEGDIESNSIPEFNAQRHRILSLASGRMFELLGELFCRSSLEGVIETKQKMWHLYEEIKEALDANVPSTYDMTIASTGDITKEAALRRLRKLPKEVRVVQADIDTSTLAYA